MKEEQIAIEDLFARLLKAGAKRMPAKEGYEVLCADNVQILTYGNRYVPLRCISRHKTPKHLVNISIESEASVGELFGKQKTKKCNEVIVTADHICMAYDRDRILQNVAAKDLSIGSYVSVYDEQEDKELVGAIVKIEDLGTTDEWVYDCEVDDGMHAFYADDVLVHNSQFIDLQAVTAWLRTQKPDLPAQIYKWPKSWKKKLWDITEALIEKEVNPFVRKLVADYCHTTQSNVLTYELEYMSAIGIYEGKKHYSTLKIFNEGDHVDIIKYAGIELKKAQVPKSMKAFLADIYEGVLKNDWQEKDYADYINSLYDRFSKFTIDEVSFWKGYNTERTAVGFLKMNKGTTGIAKACIYYNQIVDKLGLGKKYEEIRVGDKVRFCYIKECNRFGIECIAYKDGQWPAEFAQIFEVDYKKMFQKIILDPLKRFREACKFSDIDPSKQAVVDLLAL